MKAEWWIGKEKVVKPSKKTKLKVNLEYKNRNFNENIIPATNFGLA